MIGLNTFELKCHSSDGLCTEYYYFSSARSPRSPKGALNSGYAPDKMRLVCTARNAKPFEIRLIWPWEYIKKRFFTDRFFGFGKQGFRVDWQKIKVY